MLMKRTTNNRCDRDDSVDNLVIRWVAGALLHAQEDTLYKTVTSLLWKMLKSDIYDNICLAII